MFWINAHWSVPASPQKKKKIKQRKKEPKILFQKKKIVLNCTYNLTVKARSDTEASFSSRNAKLLPIWEFPENFPQYNAFEQHKSSCCCRMPISNRKSRRPGNRSVQQTEQPRGKFYTEEQQPLTGIPLAQESHSDLIFLLENTFPNKLCFSVNSCVSI